MKKIKIEDDVYDLLASLKEEKNDSFSKIIRRNLHLPAETGAELWGFYENAPAPKADSRVLDDLLKKRRQTNKPRRR